MRFIVAQLGARMHYAVPRILYQAGLLERFYTDICSVKGWPRVLNVIPKSLRSAGLKRLLSRVPEGISPSQITAFTNFGYEYAKRRARASTSTESSAVYLWGGETFCKLIVEKSLKKADCVYTFNSAGLELLRYAKTKGLITIMEQTIAPYRLELSTMAEEQERFPTWQQAIVKDKPQTQYLEREEAEWLLSDIIVCGSDFVKNGIKSCGGPGERCVVVPYGVDSRFSMAHVRKHKVPLHVLTMGAVGLRKGSPYVLEAARILKGRTHFRMVGPINVLPKAMAELVDHVDVRGPVPRSEVLEHYCWADVFLLPSLYEGSATVVYEALAAGLPVITTNNTGSIIRDGIEGYVVPIRDPEAIAERIEQLSSDSILYDKMSRNASERAKECTLAAYGKRLIASLTNEDWGTCHE